MRQILQPTQKEGLKEKVRGDKEVTTLASRKCQSSHRNSSRSRTSSHMAGPLDQNLSKKRRLPSRTEHCLLKTHKYIVAIALKTMRLPIPTSASKRFTTTCLLTDFKVSPNCYYILHSRGALLESLVDDWTHTVGLKEPLL